MSSELCLCLHLLDRCSPKDWKGVASSEPQQNESIFWSFQQKCLRKTALVLCPFLNYSRDMWPLPWQGGPGSACGICSPPTREKHSDPRRMAINAGQVENTQRLLCQPEPERSQSYKSLVAHWDGHAPRTQSSKPYTLPVKSKGRAEAIC